MIVRIVRKSGSALFYTAEHVLFHEEIGPDGAKEPCMEIVMVQPTHTHGWI